jgi:CRISPR-associated protein Csb2
MLIIALEFPAGRYHATPWGRNVNEGDAEWPPSPYRLARALIDAWKRRRPDWGEDRALPLIKALSNRVRFQLPRATASHTRSYLNINDKKNPTKKQLIFDAFIAVGRHQKLMMGIEADLSREQLADLDELLRQLNYLGRSESWIRAYLDEPTDGIEWNCQPRNGSEGNVQSEIVRVACLRGESPYKELLERPSRSATGKSKAKGGKTSETWSGALCMTTNRLLSEGWSAPPCLDWIDFERPENALKPAPPKPAKKSPRFSCVRYALYSKVPPRITETLPFAERIRLKLMGIHKRLMGGDPALVSSKFSGKDGAGNPLRGHQHAFFLPVDEDGDGRIDQLYVSATNPFDQVELQALDQLRSVWQPDRRPDVNLVLNELLVENTSTARCWKSAAPFVTGRHYRRGRGRYYDWLAGEIRRECGYHNLPEPESIEWLPHLDIKGRPVRWFEFVRARKESAPLRGHGCTLTFAEAVPGPFALGAGCHFGLGLFLPAND